MKTTKIGSATVLTNAKGFTLYTFAIDGMNKSNCNAACAHFWPPVKGPVTAAGIKGTFATTKRSDGTTEATWNGHPLYTYIGDTAPGQDKGNGLNLSGGVWHVAAVSGTPPRRAREQLLELRRRRLRVLSQPNLAPSRIAE